MEVETAQLAIRGALVVSFPSVLALNEDILMPVSKLLSYNDLVSLGVVNNRTQLSRLKRNKGFPEGFLLSANSRRWYEHEVEEWVNHLSGQIDPVSLHVSGDV